MNMDQIEWTFTHTGVACSSAKGIVSSLLIVLVGFLMSRIKAISF